MATKQVSVIISNKNSGSLLKNCIGNLDEIKKNFHENLEVIVVDNQSTDDSLKVVKEKYPWVKIVESKDLGRANANNVGAKVATGEYLLFLGVDGYPRVDTITKIAEYLDAHPDVGIATPKLSLHSGRTDYDAHRSFPTVWNSFTRLSGLYRLFPKSKTFNAYFMGHENPNIPHEIDAGVSGFLMFPSKVFNEVEGFDTDYYAYGEDLDICYRMKKKGYKVIYLPHLESGHFKLKLHQEKAPLWEKVKMAKGSTDAMRIFLHKNYKDVYPPVMRSFIATAIYAIEAQRLSAVFFKHIFTNHD